MKKLILAATVLMSSAIAMPAMADIYSDQHLRHVEARQLHHDRRVARHIHRHEVRKLHHDRRVARHQLRHERRAMHRMAVVR